MINATAKPIHREIWKNRLVEIFDEGETRSLYFGGKFLQSRMSLLSPHTLTLPYTHYMMFALLFHVQFNNILLIGLGAGSMVRFLHHHFPQCTIDAVDHSAHIIKLARGYFQLPESQHINIHCRDGLKFLAEKHVQNHYDLILIDAFDEKGMSSHIYSEEFFLICADALHPDGTLSCNLWSGTPKRTAEISNILRCNFTGRLVLPVPRRGNVIHHLKPQKIKWTDIERNRWELDHLQKKFHLNFPTMVKVARRHNLSFPQRLLWSSNFWTLH